MLLRDHPPVFLQDYYTFLRHLLPNEVVGPVGVQIEHTLVRPGGRGADGARRGAIPTKDGDHYLVRVENITQYDKCNVVIDYSLPNIHNIQTSGLFPELAEKLVYVPPLLFPCSTNSSRDLRCITMFIDEAQPRRREIRRRLSSSIAGIDNARGFFGPALHRLFCRTQVLINVHQTDHHHTLEELRILPAIQSGVVVISEDVPCRQLVPYHEHIVWCDYEAIVDTTRAVLANYPAYFERLTGPHSGLPAILERMGRELRQRIAELPGPPLPDRTSSRFDESPPAGRSR